MLYQFIICGWKNTNIIFTKMIMCFNQNPYKKTNNY